MLIRETSDLENIRIVHGIRPELVDEVARLLVEAFARKYEYQLRPRSPEQTQRLVAGSLAAELGWVALDESGTVVAAAGIDVPRRRFSHISYAMLAREFGPLSAAPRWLFALLADVFTRPRKREWRVTSIAVSESARGKGVGTRLLSVIVEAARTAGVRAVTLDVVDVNDGARRLYERTGFKLVRYLKTGRLTARGGHRGVWFMRLEL